MDWDTITMANLHLTATEHRYYGDIFIYCCENADNEVVPVVKVVELFRSANLPRDVTMKILDICVGSKNPNHLGKRQFYAVLKLLAAHQAGLEICRDLLTTPLDIITIPRFTWPTSGDENDRGGMDSIRGTKNRLHLPESTTESESEAESPRGTGGSTDSPTPTNSVIHDRNDSILGNETILDSVSGGWQGLLVSEEQRQLLGTEEESSERHSSDEADGGDGSVFPPEEVWIISDEQREYYAAQFAQLQPDLEGLLVGSVARTFFEKSRLPVAELRRIWQLADVTRDGALSLQEFYVAMHLVVLRRNHVPLPDVLPPSLLALLVTQSAVPPPAVPVTTNNQKTSSNSVSTSKEKNKEWTKFVDSPTGAGGSLTSPGLQLVNFDFQKSAVEKDPKILHPVPLRLTPEAAILASGANGNNCTTLGEDELLHSPASLVQRPMAKKPLPASDEAVIVTPKKEPPPPPPPRPYRTHARSSSLDLNKLGKNGQTFLGAPPLIPPRISPGIISPRKLVCQKSEGEGHKAMNESQGFVADFSHFSPKSELADNALIESNIVPQNHQFSGFSGAFHLYRKQSPKREGGEEADKEDIEEEKKMTLQELREKNAELRLICEELTRELASALQERINLRAKLLLLT